MGISINGPSGIDTASLIDSLVELEQTKVTKVENQKKAYQLKIDGFNKLKTLLTDLGTKAKNLAKTSSFDLFNTTSNNDKIVSITAGTGSVDASYDVKVFQLASNEKMITADHLITDQTASLSSLGIGVGTISINGTEIEIDGEDTLQDLRQKINSTKDASGVLLNVSASVLKVADDNYRLVFTSKTSGSTGIEYKDITGSTLQDLGIIASADGNKGTTNQALTSAGNVQAAWEGLAEGESVTITGKDRAGSDITATFIKHAGDTADDFITQVNKAFNGMVDVTFDGSGTLTITDRVGGASQLSISELSIGAGIESMAVTTYGEEGAGVLSVGRDSFFSIENIFMSNSSNTATGFVNGVTFDFNGISKEENVTVSLERDIDGLRAKFQEMVDAYNAILRYSKSVTKVADPTDEDATSGALAGDSTVRSIASQINNFFHQQFDELNSVYTNFSMLGVKTNTSNGELEIDSEMFDKALTEEFDEVVNLFTTVGFSDNQNVVLGTSTADTKSGTYVLEEIDATHFRARLDGDTTWYTSDTRMGEIIAFSEGPLKGLSLTAAAGSIGVGNSATFTMSKGLSTIIDDAVENMTDSHDGIVALRTESYNQSIRRTEDKITQLEDRIEKYRLRLVNQFSAMEQTLNTMQTQMSNMLSQLGMSTD